MRWRSCRGWLDDVKGGSAAGEHSMASRCLGSRALTCYLGLIDTKSCALPQIAYSPLP